MKRQLLLIGLATIIATAIPVTLLAQPAQTTREYSKEHPLVYEDAWDLWPFCFLNEQGQPDGYNIELLHIMLGDMGIPYEIRLKPTIEALNDLRDGKSDLTLGMADDFHAEYASFGQTVVKIFTHSVVYPKSQGKLIKTLSDVAKQKVIVHKGSFFHHLMMEKGWGMNAIAYNDMQEAVQKVGAEQQGQIVWNTLSLKFLLRKYNLSELQMGAVDVPHGEYRFMSRDTILLNQLDQAYTQLKSSGRLEPIQNKWFYPERQETGIPSWLWYVMGGMAIATFILLYYNVAFRNREHRETALAKKQNLRLTHILQTSHLRIWTYDVTRQLYTLMDDDGKPLQELNLMEFTQYYRDDNLTELFEAIHSVATMQRDGATVEVKAHEDGTLHDFLIAISVLRRDKDGRPILIMGVRSDITEERTRQRKAKTLLTRYKSIFDTALIDMIYFDAEGQVINMNERARNTFGIDSNRPINEQFDLRNMIDVDQFDFNNLDYFYATLAINRHDSKRHATLHQAEGLMFYAMQLVPVYDHAHQLLGVYGTGQEITEFVENWRRQKASTEQLAKAYKKVNGYVRNIDYVLKVGGLRIAKYSPDTHTLTIFSEANVAQLTLTQSRCMTLVNEQSKKRAMRMLNSMDNLTTNNISVEIGSVLHHHGRQLILQFYLIPTYNQQGQIDHYFGLCRDISEVRATEQLLEKETARAQEVEELKDSFLRNMSYEIRTPLNAVVGFSELFEMDHSPEDEEVFVGEIKDNAAYLLRLINDILFLSRLDAHMIEINPQPTDFAQTFESHSQMGWANNQHEGVRYIVENHYERLVIDIDDANLGRVIEQLTANAAQHTESGVVRARYDYVSDKLMIAIEDTGCGISPNDIKHVYERFVIGQHGGTGLGLPICKELTEQLGGTIDISSEVGKGTTVWITIPCKAYEVERKKEI